MSKALGQVYTEKAYRELEPGGTPTSTALASVAKVIVWASMARAIMVMGVLGTHIRGRLGVVGAVMRGGAGVVGLSVESVGNPAALVHDLFAPDSTGVFGSSDSGDGVSALSHAADKSGVFGFNDAGGIGVAGRSTLGDGISGVSEAADTSGVFGFNGAGGIGVAGRSTRGDGMSGVSEAADKSGVFGFNEAGGIGVAGASDNGNGVSGHSKGFNHSGVIGENTAAPSRRSPAEVFGVTGRANSAAGTGVLGDSKGGIGVSGRGGTYGATFEGGRAPIRLIPSAGVGAPTAGFHQRGELYVDSDGELFYCKGNGTPGTWFRVSLTPV